VFEAIYLFVVDRAIQQPFAIGEPYPLLGRSSIRVVDGTIRFGWPGVPISLRKPFRFFMVK
jgi:hypothetical protein